MGKKSSEPDNLALQFFMDQKKSVDLLRERTPKSGFDLAVRRVFGDDPKPGKKIRIGHREFKYSSRKKDLVSFLPAQWQADFDKMVWKWRGCENWWAGYPLIVWTELRAGDERKSGKIYLKAEVGPISIHEARKAIIQAIRDAASAKDRIQFAAGATREGCLYSRFLTQNTAIVENIHNADIIETQMVRLIADFEPEFSLIARAISQLAISTAL